MVKFKIGNTAYKSQEEIKEAYLVLIAKDWRKYIQVEENRETSKPERIKMRKYDQIKHV